MNDIEILTFGCRLNSFESEVIRRNAQNLGLHDVIIFNTCAVTAEAERQVRQKIRAVAKKNPERKIIVAGCAAQLNPQIFAAMPEVYKVVGNLDKIKPESLDSNSPKVIVSEIKGNKSKVTLPKLNSIEGKSKAFIQVQQGCNNSCTFCIVPSLRGNAVSQTSSEIREQIQNFLTSGYQEIILTGVDISAYGVDFSPRQTLADLVENILQNITFPSFRLRLSSLDPAHDYTKLLELFKNDERLMPHFHFSVQSGDNEILRLMKRRHKREDVIHWATAIKKINPYAAIGADIITGFPSESEEHFLNSERLLEEAHITHAHVFPFSIRPGTPSATMSQQVPKEIAKTRAKILIEKAYQNKLQLGASMINQEVKVLVEKNGFSGYSENYMMVHLDKKMPEGCVIKAQILSNDEKGLMAKCLEN